MKNNVNVSLNSLNDGSGRVEPSLQFDLTERQISSNESVKTGILSTVLNSNLKYDYKKDDILNINQETNSLIKNIPLLTEIVSENENILIKDIPSIKDVNYTVIPLIDNKSIKILNSLEQQIHLEISNKYKECSDVISYKEFWMYLYNTHEQGLFNKDYYISWLLIWISSLDKEKINILCFSFIWRSTCELSDSEVFEIIKPNLNSLSQFKEITVIFTLLESINLAGIYLPTDWLENYLKFNDNVNYKNIENPKNFLMIMKNNKQMLKKG